VQREREREIGIYSISSILLVNNSRDMYWLLMMKKEKREDRGGKGRDWEFLMKNKSYNHYKISIFFSHALPRIFLGNLNTYPYQNLIIHSSGVISLFEHTTIS
jgi:hypothetical protein